MDTVIDLKKYSSFIKKTDFVKKTGKVNRVIGLVLEGDGPAVSVEASAPYILTIVRLFKPRG